MKANVENSIHHLLLIFVAGLLPTTDVGQIRDVIPDGERGLLCPPGSPEALASAMNEILSDAERDATAAPPFHDGLQTRLFDVHRIEVPIMPWPAPPQRGPGPSP